MYLKSFHIENSGPLRSLSLELPFTRDGIPKPVVLVGSNGSGKTNLISIVADALFEAAAQHYQDVVPNASGITRPWFRLAGGTTVSTGASGSLVIMQFEHNGTAHFFKEKVGNVDLESARSRIPVSLQPVLGWPPDSAIKEFQINDSQAQDIFESGVYVCFPSSRAETPHWLNLESVPEIGFDVQRRIQKRLRKSVYMERGLEPLTRWLLTVLLDSRVDPTSFFQAPPQPAADGRPQILITQQGVEALKHQQTWNFMNQIIRAIIGDVNARLVWLTRYGPGGLAIQVHESSVIPSLNALSAGQATLLNIFGTLVRYADEGRRGQPISLGDTRGICLIDEVDAHMHIDLQYKALPILVRMFPRIQFIMSTHSPLFVLGMEQAFGGDGTAVIELPLGTPIAAESYAEFGRALEVIRATKAFTQAIADAASRPGKMLVLMEGETDPIYCRTAIELLGRGELLDRVEIDWVGAKDPNGNQGYNTGVSGLRNTFNALKANPGLLARSVLLIYDNDTNVPELEVGSLTVRRVPGQRVNQRFDCGIESLLAEDVFTDEMIDEHTERKGNGKKIIVQEINKMRLCKFVCDERRNPSDFRGFAELLEVIEQVSQAV